ncbi:MAG: hypothetical protein ACRETH_13210 [Steroidobacteraceae bacterium]
MTTPLLPCLCEICGTPCDDLVCDACHAVQLAAEQAERDEDDGEPALTLNQAWWL